MTISSYSSSSPSFKRERPEETEDSQPSKMRKIEPALVILAKLSSFPQPRTPNPLKIDHLVEDTQITQVPHWKIRENNSVTLKPFLTKKCILAPFTNPIKIDSRLPVGISKNVDLTALKVVNDACHEIVHGNDSALDFTQLHITDIHTCFKIFQIADWLHIPELFTKIDEFLEAYLKPLNPKLNVPIHELLELRDFQQLQDEADQKLYLDTMHAGFNTDLQDVLLWYKNENLPKAHVVAEQKIQAWLKSPPNIKSIIEKCQLLAKRNIYLDNLDLSLTGETTDENVNAIIDCQPYIKNLNLSNTCIEGNINLQKLSKLTSFVAFNTESLTGDALGPNLQGLPLKSLILYKGTFTNTFGPYLATLPLETLKIVKAPGLTNEFGAFLTKLPLKQVYFSNCVNLSNDFIKHLVGLKLESFSLLGSPITDASGVHIASFSPTLKHLEISACELLTDIFGTSLIDMKKLRSLVAVNCNFSNGFGAPIANLGLTHLNMAGNEQLTSEFGDHVSQMVHLIDLDMSETFVEDGFGDSIAHLRLKSLRMNRCFRLTSIFGNTLIGMPLESLDISNCSKFTNFSFLAHLTLLKTLNISGCYNLKNDQFQFIQNLAHLNWLDVSGCYALNSQVGQYLNLPSLETLLMEGCILLSDDLGPFLAQIQSLKDVDLSYCYGFTHNFSASINMIPNLQFLRMVGCQLPPAFKENLEDHQINFIDIDLSDDEVSISDEDLTDEGDLTDFEGEIVEMGEDLTDEENDV